MSANSVIAFGFSPLATSCLARPSLNKRECLLAKFCHSITASSASSISKERVIWIANPLISPLDFTSFGRMNVQPVAISNWSSIDCMKSIIFCGVGGVLNSALPFPSILVSLRTIEPAICFIVSLNFPLI